MKQLHQELDRYKSDKETVETAAVSIVSQIDQQDSIINFLATVVADAEDLGLDYEKIFDPTSSSIDSN